MIKQTMGADNGAIAVSHTVAGTRWQQLTSVTLNLSAAPTTAGNLTIALDSGQGAEYDTTLYTVDPAATAMTDLLWQPAQPLYLRPGDTIHVAYANADTWLWGVIVTALEVAP